jgi:hypothetical protein
MKKRSFFLVLLFSGTIGFLFFNQLFGILIAGQKPPLPKLPSINSFKNLLDVRRFLQQPPAYPEKMILVSGIGSGNSDLTTKNVWATAMNDNLEARDYAEIGFCSIVLENASSVPWTGVAVSATFDVTMVQGKIQLVIRAFKDGGSIASRDIQQTSAGQYTVKTDPFVMEPGYKYVAKAYIACIPDSQQLSAGIGKILEIKWII